MGCNNYILTESVVIDDDNSTEAEGTLTNMVEETGSRLVDVTMELVMETDLTMIVEDRATELGTTMMEVSGSMASVVVTGLFMDELLEGIDEITGKDEDVVGKDEDVVRKDEDVVRKDEDVIGKDEEVIGNGDDVIGKDDCRVLVVEGEGDGVKLVAAGKYRLK